MLRALKAHQGPVMISGYKSELYKSELKGWYDQDIKSNCEKGKAAIETIWTNYETFNQMRLDI